MCPLFSTLLAYRQDHNSRQVSCRHRPLIHQNIDDAKPAQQLSSLKDLFKSFFSPSLLLENYKNIYLFLP